MLSLSNLHDSRPRLCQNEEDSDNIDYGRSGLVFVEADIYQACIINKNLPKGFKIEQEDTVRRAF